MADNYASAAVTIIAAAGEDPSHGLSWVRRNSHGLTCFDQVRSIGLFANPSSNPTTELLRTTSTNQFGLVVRGHSKNAMIRQEG